MAEKSQRNENLGFFSGPCLPSYVISLDFDLHPRVGHESANTLGLDDNDASQHNHISKTMFGFLLLTVFLYLCVYL